jgi:hypothetical protein
MQRGENRTTSDEVGRPPAMPGRQVKKGFLLYFSHVLRHSPAASSHGVLPGRISLGRSQQQ